MTHPVNSSSCADNHRFISAADGQADWLSNSVPAPNRTLVPKEVDWLGRPTGAENLGADPYLRLSRLPSVTAAQMSPVGQKRTSRPPASLSLTFGQRSCLAVATGAAFTGTLGSGYTAKAVATPICLAVPPPYNVGCVGGIVGGGAVIGGFVGGMTATQSPICKGKVPWNR